MIIQKLKNSSVSIENLDSLMNMLKIDKNYKQALKYGGNNYNVSQYKINKVKLQEIPQLINLIEVNYINIEKEGDQTIDKKKYSWLANELKLFVWMAICHSYLSNKPLEQYTEQDWQFFTQIFTRKTSHDLEFQSKSLFKNYHGNKQKWDQQEQELLKLIIEDQQNKNKWNQISRLLYFRSNKKYYRSSQKCREYWFNHLDPNLNKNPWTVDEDLRLVKELQAYGFKWSKLTQIIQSTWGYRRTQHMVKNRTKYLIKKYGYKDDKQQGCMKELKMIQRKLNEQKLKPTSSSTTNIKQEQEFNSSSQNESPNKKNEQKQTKNTPSKKKIQKQEQKKKQLQSSSSQQQELDQEQQSQMISQQSQQIKKNKNKKINKKQEVQDKSNNKRKVIILHQANQQKQINQEQLVQQEQDEPQIIVVAGNEQQNDDRQLEIQDNRNQQPYPDQYGIIEEVPDQQIDLNQDIQFQHHTHGGTMRERVTHQLAKFFPSSNATTQNPY